MYASIWLALVAAVLVACYMLCKRPLQRMLGIDPHRATPGNQSDSALPVWLLLAAQVTLLVGLAPLFSAALLLRYGILPMVLWTVLGALLLGAIPNLALLWASLRSGGKQVGALMYTHLGGRGKQALCVLGWLLAVLMLVMTVGVVSSNWDKNAQTISPDDYLVESDALTAARQTPGANLTDFVDTQAYEQARLSLLWEAHQRTVAATATLGLLLLSGLYGLALLKWKKYALPLTVLALCAAPFIVSLCINLPIALSHTVWVYLLLAYALISALMPMRWLSMPRDTLMGLGTIAMALSCALIALFLPIKVTQPTVVAFTLPGTGSLLPYVFLTTVAGGANAVYLLSTSLRGAKFTAREQEAYPVTVGGTMIAAFVGVLVAVAIGQYDQLPLSALQDVYAAPRLLIGGLTDLLMQGGLPMTAASLWVHLVCIGCALSALDVAARLGTLLIHNIYFNQTVLPRPFSVERVLAATITVAAAFLLSGVDYWALWPLFGAVSMGLCAVAILPVVVWLKTTGRTYWVLGGCAGLLAGLSLWSMGASLFTQWDGGMGIPSTNTVFLHVVVALLLIATMIHACTGIGQPAREMPLSRNESIDE